MNFQNLGQLIASKLCRSLSVPGARFTTESRKCNAVTRAGFKGKSTTILQYF